ncbi:response regulator [Sphingomonas glacialis]|uniref:response regulator n=1 Tax=Sphingomonas glacialis TaxID=658225 RepID=UPI003D69F2CD
MLLVEDDPSIRAISEIALKLDPFVRVESVDCGCDAIGAALQAPVVFDAILLDVCLPDMSGFEVMTSLDISMGSSRPPIIIFTGLVRPQLLELYADAGATAVIPKPFDPITLAQHLRHCVLNRYQNCDRWWKTQLHPKGSANFRS